VIGAFLRANHKFDMRKIAMEPNRLAIPYHRQLCQQINMQQYAYGKSGHLQFSHQASTRDDILLSLALGVMLAR